tara:strand:+ start:280 stop:624 length:345 start_codon:yes stop_codon:yes gene_type:complete
MSYYDHYNLAWEQWFEHVKNCAAELAADSDAYENYTIDWQEREQMEESFADCEQLKMLDSGHVKLKWEHRCWWADCKHPVFHGEYYCVVAEPVWEKPHVAFATDPHQKKLGEEE